MSTVQHYSCHTRIVTNMAKLHGIDCDKMYSVLYGSMGTSMNNGCPSHIGDKSGLPWLPHPSGTKGGCSSSWKQINSEKQRRFAYRSARRS
jgi:hypothetical protein